MVHINEYVCNRVNVYRGVRFYAVSHVAAVSAKLIALSMVVLIEELCPVTCTNCQVFDEN